MCRLPCIRNTIHISIKIRCSWNCLCRITSNFIFCIDISACVVSCLCNNPCIDCVTVRICCTCFCKHRFITILCVNYSCTCKTFGCIWRIGNFCLICPRCCTWHLFPLGIVSRYGCISFHIIAVYVETARFCWLTHIYELVKYFFSCTYSGFEIIIYVIGIRISAAIACIVSPVIKHIVANLQCSCASAVLCRVAHAAAANSRISWCMVSHKVIAE